MRFSVLLAIIVWPNSLVIKKLKLLCRKSKLGMQNLSYAGLILGINSPSNLKAATSIDCFKQDIKKYFLEEKCIIRSYYSSMVKLKGIFIVMFMLRFLFFLYLNVKTPFIAFYNSSWWYFIFFFIFDITLSSGSWWK